MSTLKWILVAGVAGYAALVLLLFVAQRSLMYFPDPVRRSPADHGVLNATTETLETSDGEKAAKVAKLKKDETLMLNIGSTSTGGKVLAVSGDTAQVVLTAPVCTKEGEKIALSRRVENHWRLIGWGRIAKGTKLELHSR